MEYSFTMQITVVTLAQHPAPGMSLYALKDSDAQMRCEML